MVTGECKGAKKKLNKTIKTLFMHYVSYFCLLDLSLLVLNLRKYSILNSLFLIA